MSDEATSNDGIEHQPLQEQVNYWRSRAEQLRNEVERLTQELEVTERQLAEAQSRSHTPQEQQAPEPFSQ